MLISVALPIFNGEPLLRRALESILAQDTELELIISDDRSNDNSLETVARLADPRIHLIRNERNVGIFGNLNRCIQKATGEFIQVFSQDDLMKPGYLLSQVTHLEKYPNAGLVYGTPEYIDGNDNITPLFVADTTPELIEWPLYLWISSHYGTLAPSISSIMFRRGTIDAVGAFDESYQVAGDIEFYNRVAQRYAIVRNLEVLHSVRSHARMTSALPTAGEKYLREEVRLADWYRSHWTKSNYRKISHFRAALRGRYHMGWIARAILRGQFAKALRAGIIFNDLYPIHWAIWWQLCFVLDRKLQPQPEIPAPC